LFVNQADDNDQAAMIGSLEERNQTYERRMKGQISDIITSIVGPNNARIQVTAEIDYNRITQTSDTFDPNGQVVRSTQTREETSNSRAAGGGGGVSVGNELPGAAGSGGGGGGAGAAEAANKTEEVVNYEISKTTKTEVIEAGRVKKVSVAVLVDGSYVEGADGKAVYTPRPQEQLDQIATLVRSAVGFDQARGDQVEVINMQFAPTAAPAPLEEGSASWYELKKDDYFYIAELATLLIVAVLVLLLVVRPLIRRIVTPEDNGAIDVASLTVSGGDDGPGEIVGPNGETIMIGQQSRPNITAGESKASTLIDVAQIAGEVHGKTVKKVAELVRTNPDEAVAIVRQWMSQEEAA
jgi:flagellar M-ring protein FliF